MIDLHLYQHPPWNLLKNPTSGEYVPYFSISLSQFIQSSYNIMECEVGQRGERERDDFWNRMETTLSPYIYIYSLVEKEREIIRWRKREDDALGMSIGS